MHLGLAKNMLGDKRSPLRVGWQEEVGAAATTACSACDCTGTAPAVISGTVIPIAWRSEHWWMSHLILYLEDGAMEEGCTAPQAPLQKLRCVLFQCETCRNGTAVQSVIHHSIHVRVSTMRLNSHVLAHFVCARRQTVLSWHCRECWGGR